MVSRFRSPLLAALLLAGLGFGHPAPAQANTQDEINARLAADPVIWQGMFTLAVGDQIRTHCDRIEARVLRTTSFIYGLYNRARDYGFSRQEIRGFQTADSTEARLRAEVLAYFAEHGVREGEPETYCALGDAEIAAGTQAGELLTAR